MNIPFRRYWELLGPYLLRQKGRFSLLSVLLLSSIGLQVVNPQIVRRFVDVASAGGAVETLLSGALVFVTIALLQQAVSVGAAYVGESVAWSATNALRRELAHHCLELDMGFHNDTSPGELIERIDGDVAELSLFFSQLVVLVIGNLLLLGGILIALFVEDWRVGAPFSLLIVVTLYALNRVRGIAIPHQKALRETLADLMGYLEERLSGTEDIRSSGAVDYCILGLYKIMFRVLGHWSKASVRFVVVRLTGGVLLTLGNAMALLIGYVLFEDGVFTIGTVYLVVHYAGLFGRPIHVLTQHAESLQNVGAATERLVDLRRVEHRVLDGPGATFPPGPLSLAFESVSFAYAREDREPEDEEEPLPAEDGRVLKDVSFRLEPGRVLGLLGRTGSGKTTLARLLFRFYDPGVGRIVLGGVDVRQPTLRDLRQRVAIVTQDVQLFQASVRDNLTFFDRAVPDERLLAVIEEMELAGWYRSLPEGLDSGIETGGRSLSAGEGQLLAFARVFLRDPGLVILDEASSRLDPATEQRIERAVDRLLTDRTAIVIAHRLATVQRADEILILEAGGVAESGARGRLAGDPTSRFYGLLRAGLEEVLV